MPQGLHSEKIGIKKIGFDPKDFMSDLFILDTIFDPPSLTALATPATASAVSAGIAVTGALLGDRVELFPPYDMQGIIASGYVSAADTVKISLLNPTAGVVDLPSGTWTIHVIRK